MEYSIAGISKIDKNYRNGLKEEELEQYRNLPAWRKTDFLLGRLALKQAFVNYTGKNLGDAGLINNTEDGLPYVDGWNNINCSLSHSYDLGVAIVSTFKSGIDIEKVRPHDQSLISYIANRNETLLVENAFGDETDIITLIWVIKESVMKALGTGFSIPPTQVNIIRRSSGSAFVVKAQSNHWHVWVDRIGDFYVGIAFEKKNERKPTINWYTSTSLSIA